MHKIAPFAILTASLDEVRLAFLGLVLKVGLRALSELLNSVCELALVEISAKPCTQVVST